MDGDEVLLSKHARNLERRLARAEAAAKVRHTVLRQFGYDGPPLMSGSDITPFFLRGSEDLIAKLDDALAKLATARAALKFYEQHMQLGYEITDSGQIATEALSATAPTP